MAPDLRSHASAGSLPSVRSFVAVVLARQTYENLAYLALAFPLGLLYFLVLVTAFAVSASLLVLVVGVPLLLASLLLTLALGRFEILLTDSVLDVEIPTPSHGYLFEGSALDRARGLVTDRTTWTTLVYLTSKFVFGTLVLVVLGVPLTICGAFLTAPLYYDVPGVTVGVQVSEPVRLTPSLSVPWNELAVGVETVFRVTSWQVDTLAAALALSLAGLLGLVVVLNLSNGIARVWAWYSRRMLGRRGPASIRRGS
jgi:hypothetical protein